MGKGKGLWVGKGYGLRVRKRGQGKRWGKGEGLEVRKRGESYGGKMVRFKGGKTRKG